MEVPAEEGSGGWELVSVSDAIYMIVTDCDYLTSRFERVPSEGLVEFHFVFEGPVELALPRNDESSLSVSTVVACHQAPGVSYDVLCLPGRSRIISLYVRPDLLADSFGFGRRSGTRAARLMQVSSGAMSTMEAATSVEVVSVLRDVFQSDFSTRRGLMLAMAKIFELLALTTALLDAESADGATGVAFTEADLAMFSKALEILSRDPARSPTIADLAKQLGTNSNKLKSGFKLLYGMTIFTYRNSHRMTRAMEMLIDPRISIAAIAHVVGYEHQASFTTAFKAHFGITPKKARELALQKSP